jgi:glycosyltransferase involved in cell wall biosynthesis
MDPAVLSGRSVAGLAVTAADRTRAPRLLVVASTFPRSADDSAPAFVRDLAMREATRYDTTVLVPAVEGGAREETTHGLHVRRFRYFPRRWEDLADGAILENLRTRRSRWLQVLPFLIAEAFVMRRLVRRLRPDVMHVHWIIPQGLVALVARGGRPMLVTTLGGDVYGLTDPISRRLVRAVLRRAAAVTTMNEEMRERLVRLGARPDTVHVLPMGADVEGIRALAAGVERVPGQVLFVGRLVEKKGLPVLLDALRTLADTGVHLRVVGDGPLLAELQQRAEGLPVTFVGALSRDRLAREDAAAAVAVFPSVRAASGDQDGLPVALLEALAAGCPVVASDLPGLDEAVVDGKSGLLFPAGDADALADALRRVLDDPATAAELSAGASARADEYSVAAIGARYADLLDAVRAGG